MRRMSDTDMLSFDAAQLMAAKAAEDMRTRTIEECETILREELAIPRSILAGATDPARRALKRISVLKNAPGS